MNYENINKCLETMINNINDIVYYYNNNEPESLMLLIIYDKYTLTFTITKDDIFIKMKKYIFEYEIYIGEPKNKMELTIYSNIDKLVELLKNKR